MMLFARTDVGVAGEPEGVLSSEYSDKALPNAFDLGL